MKNLLDSETIPLQPISATQLIRQNKKGYTPAWILTQNDEGQKVLVSNFFNTTKTSAIGAWLPIILGGLALLMAIACLVAGFIWLIRYGLLTRTGLTISAMPVRMPLWGYTLSLLTFAATLIIWISTDPFALGTMAFASITVFIASVLTAVFAIWAFTNLIRYQRQIPNRADRTFLWIAVCSALLTVGYLAVWGLIGLRLWT